QLAFELVQKTPIGILGNDLLRSRLDQPRIAQPQRIKSDGILGVVVPPFVVLDFANSLEGVVVLARDASVDELPRDSRRVANAEVGGVENRPERSLGRDRVPPGVFTVGRNHAAKVLRPRAVDRRIQNHVTSIAGAYFLRLGREGKERVDLALCKQVERL